MSKRKSDNSTSTDSNRALPDQVEAVIAELKRLATKKTLDGMARYAIPSDKAFGVSVGDIQRLAKKLGRNHDLAEALWKTGWYEARMLTAYVDEPEKVTPAQMDRWCREFDNWGICDTICFCLFDRTPHAWKKARQWAKSPREFVKRTGYVLMACLAGHDKTATDKQLLDLLPLIEQGAQDERNFVKKGVSWALRMIGRRSLPLNKAALAAAKRLSLSQDVASGWVGKDAFRELSNPKVQARLNRRTE
jgi:3-methyladenine DNA glycosylase AlkD